MSHYQPAPIIAGPSSSSGTVGGSREARSKDPGRVLDDASRERRQKKALELLEMDNFQDEPHADLVMSKKVPKFDDSLESQTPKKGEKGGVKRKKNRPPDYYKKYRKSFAQLLEEDTIMRRNDFNYTDAQAGPPRSPARHFCGVCGFVGTYTCPQCGCRYCCVRCYKTHQETRCLKWTS